ncbi:hypothetical protein ACPWR0_18495 [Pandoraea pneumonica]|uniref:hypothetical protein n=1 Tax=Pandoraea pneumonica TaxID=2508299 RepID=UPI003CE6885F
MMPLSSTTHAPSLAAMPSLHPIAPASSSRPSAVSSTISNATTPYPASLMTLPLTRLLAEFREGHLATPTRAHILRHPEGVAAKELLALCEFASAAGQEFQGGLANLRHAAISLLAVPPSLRTLDQLRDIGMFRTVPPHEFPSRDDLDLLSSDDGLLLWLKYGANADGYQRLFIDYVSEFLRFETTNVPPASNIGPALRMLVAIKRDAAYDVPDPLNAGHALPPLSHLCATHAPDWLPFLLDISDCANQRDRCGYPLLYPALVATTNTSRATGRTPHEINHALQDCVALLVNHGATLTVSDFEGTPLTVRLIRDGYIDAARVLIQCGACPSSTDSEMRSVLHHLSTALQPTSLRNSAAVVAYIAALAAGADPQRANARGETAFELLPRAQREHFRFISAHYARWSHFDAQP